MSAGPATAKTDGAAGPPMMAPAPGAPNSALKEPAPKAGDGVDPQHPCRADDVVIVDAEAGVVTGTRRKIAICGFASSSRDQIPVHDPSWELWGLNQLYRHIGRADRWFDIHHNWNEEVVPGTDHHGWIRDCGIPVYMLQRHPDLPTSVSFPIARLLDRWGVDYFTSTIAYMVALAFDEIEQRVEAQLLTETFETPADVIRRQREEYGTYVVGLFGIDLVVGEEYFEQKPCAEFWLGALSSRGVTVHLPEASALCKQDYRYGYEKPAKQHLSSREIEEHVKKMDEEHAALVRKLYMLDGARQTDEHWHALVQLRERGAKVR